MVAVDTNVLIRLITKDHAAQVARASRLFQREQIWVAKTVLLETDWLLRSLYGFAPQAVGDAFRKLAGLPNVDLEDPSAVTQALSWLASSLFKTGKSKAALVRLQQARTFAKDRDLLKFLAGLETRIDRHEHSPRPVPSIS